jgi:hypothetical protein
MPLKFFTADEATAIVPQQNIKQGITAAGLNRLARMVAGILSVPLISLQLCHDVFLYFYTP